MRPVGRRFEPGRAGRPLSIVPKYIIVTEGYRTEQIYFDALRENRAVAGISGLVDIVLLQREPADSGLSHPLVLLDLLEKYMECVRSRRYSVDLVLEVACNEVLMGTGATGSDSRMERFRLSARDAVGCFADRDGFIDDLPAAVRSCGDVAHEVFGVRPGVIMPELIDYRPETDRVCVVVDRDTDNRGPQTMDEFIKECRGRGYEPYISNPCFELWLMMHFDAFDREDRRMLLRNPMKEVHGGGAGPHRRGHKAGELVPQDGLRPGHVHAPHGRGRGAQHGAMPRPGPPEGRARNEPRRAPDRYALGEGQTRPLKTGPM